MDSEQEGAISVVAPSAVGHSYTKGASSKAWQMLFRTKRDKTVDLYVIFLSDDADESLVGPKRNDLFAKIVAMQYVMFGDLRGFNSSLQKDIADMPHQIEIGFYEQYDDLIYCTAQYIGSFIAVPRSVILDLGHKFILDEEIELFTVGNIP